MIEIKFVTATTEVRESFDSLMEMYPLIQKGPYSAGQVVGVCPECRTPIVHCGNEPIACCNCSVHEWD